MATPAPRGELGTYEADSFAADGKQHPVFRKGHGPAVIVITEMPGITPLVLGFADRLVDMGCSVALPDLYGDAGRDPWDEPTASTARYMARSAAKACVSREFSLLALGRTSPIASWLRALAASEHDRWGGPGVGTVGMCFSGGFALAMATNPAVVAPVMAQPSLPFPVSGSRRRNIDVSPQDLDTIAGRCTAEGLRVLGLRFHGDSFVPGPRFGYLKDQLGDGFISVELSQADGNPTALQSPLVREHHSVLTASLNDEPGQPTQEALHQVLDFLRSRLLSSAGDGS